MADAPALTIRRDWPRPSEAERAAFRDAPTGWVVDAQGRRGALDHRIRPVTRATRILGVALPVWSRGGDNLAPYAALRFARPGDVLMVATEAFETASVAGDILVGMARNAGIVGCITDGVVRDIPGLDAVGIPVFARGVTPNSPQKDGPGTIGLPIVLGGVTVAPGDLIVADGDGVVVVPRATLAVVGAELAAIARKEAEMDATVQAGAKEPGWLAERLSRPDVRFVD
ncbi:RraA family protein [Elioraea sp.]|uniref:RraA family protein n=1 Tax=Elioraea sp. TaxID=2185103 RepID=UPI0021DB8EB2|nr:4-hydroxy-4-methyl-2-oxoglutarate aldolase [Elioraea sp.]GIX11865.1 MAG: methyltransferase [Elioraea sp.]